MNSKMWQYKRADAAPCPAFVPMRWTQVFLFLLQAAAGGAVAGYVLTICDGIYHSGRQLDPLLIILFPFCMAVAAVFAVLIGSVTLVLENLIEERLSRTGVLIGASVIATLAITGLVSIWAKVNVDILKLSMTGGIAIGSSIALATRRKDGFWLTLLMGVSTPPFEIERPNSQFLGFVVIAGLALRLVSIVGVLVAGMVLASCWSFQEMDQRMVTIYAIYYFAATAYASTFVRHRGLLIGAGMFVNGFLLILALFWDPTAAQGQPGVLMTAFIVLAFMWSLFVGFHPRRRHRKVLAPSFSVNK